MATPPIMLLLACTAARPESALNEVPIVTTSTEDDCPQPSLVGRFTLTAYPGMDAVGPNGERPMPISKNYTFTDSTYVMEGYPELTITGSYSVLSVDEQRIQVLFTDTIFDGSSQPDTEQWLTFSDCGKTLEMEGMTYQRLEPSG